MSAMKLDWSFLARNLARHLASVDDVEAIERIMEDAERDALALDAPPEFWMRVADEYRSAQRCIGPAGGNAIDELGRRQPHRPIFANDSYRRSRR
jgi:hypothetical protein